MGPKLHTNPFIFNSFSRQRFLKNYNSKLHFSELEKAHDYATKKSKIGVYLLCLSLMEIIFFPCKFDIDTFEQENNFFEFLKNSFAKFSFSNELKIFLESVLLTPNLNNIPSFSVLKNCVMKFETHDVSFSQNDKNYFESWKIAVEFFPI